MQFNGKQSQIICFENQKQIFLKLVNIILTLIISTTFSQNKAVYLLIFTKYS